MGFWVRSSCFIVRSSCFIVTLCVTHSLYIRYLPQHLRIPSHRHLHIQHNRLEGRTQRFQQLRLQSFQFVADIGTSFRIMHMALLLTILSVLVITTNAFSSTKSPRFSRSIISFVTTTQKPVTSEVRPVQLRALELFDQNGAKKEVDSLMGDGKSVVIFLRHLG